jgi:hypothetical protein
MLKYKRLERRRHAERAKPICKPIAEVHTLTDKSISNKEKTREYYLNHREQIRARSAARYIAKREEILAQQKQRRDNNIGYFHELEKQRYWKRRDILRARARADYKKHAAERMRKAKIYQAARPEKVKEWRQRWLKANPQKRRNAIRNNTSMRRRKGNGRYSLKQLLDKYAFHGWRCYLCSTPVTLKTSHPDHRKPLGRGGTNWIANIAPACIQCNLTKNRRTESEYRALLKSQKAR